MADDCNMSRLSSRALEVAERNDRVKKKKKKRKKKGVKFTSDGEESGEEGQAGLPKPDDKPQFTDLIENKE